MVIICVKSAQKEFENALMTSKLTLYLANGMFLATLSLAKCIPSKIGAAPTH